MALAGETMLFPNRGSKAKRGHVYQPLAFASTQPRNLMPGHLTSHGADARVKANAERVARNEKKLTALRLKALEMHDRVFKLDQEHKKRSDKYFSSKRLTGFHKGIQHLHRLEDDLRPSDQTGFLRNYSSLDQSTWKMGEMRDWYNKYAPSTPATGTVGRDTTDSLPSKPWCWGGATDGKLSQTSNVSAEVARAARASAGRASARSSLRSSASTTSLPHMPSSRRSTASASAASLAAGVYPGVRSRHEAHWLDAEGTIREQRARDRSAVGDYTLRKPWLDRPVDEGAAPPPSMDKLMERERELYKMTGYAEGKTGVQTLKSRMYHGEGKGVLPGTSD